MKFVCQWGGVLPTHSVKDTQQTIDEHIEEYATFALTCPNHKHLLPE